jgi:hypothetical protein
MKKYETVGAFFEKDSPLKAKLEACLALATTGVIHELVSRGNWILELEEEAIKGQLRDFMDSILDTVQETPRDPKRIIGATRTFQPPYRVGKKRKIAVLDTNGLEVVIFPVGMEKAAEDYCKFLNGRL